MEQRDLFGEVPVTCDELLAWMLAVPCITPASPVRFWQYVRDYDVVEKIRAAKLAGTFDAAISRPLSPGVTRRLAAAAAQGIAFQ